MKIVSGDGSGNLGFQITDIEGDMGEPTRLELIQQADGDVIVTMRLTQDPDRFEDARIVQPLSIEFCFGGAGGSRNPVISQKLRELIAVLVSQAQAG